MSNAKRTYADRREYLIEAVSKRRRQMKQRAIEYLGGKCIFCGYHKYPGALDFHHLDDSKKSFSLSQEGLTRSWKKTLQELQKCVLVCANSHREIHRGILQPSSVMKSGNTG